MESEQYSKFSYRSIWQLAWPIIVSNLLMTLTMTVDLIMVGRLGSGSIAAVGLSNQLTFFATSLMIATSVGTVAIISRHEGAGERDRANDILSQSIYIGAILAIPLMVIGLTLGRPILALIGSEPEVAALGGGYIRVVALAAPFMFINTLCIAAFRALGDTRTPLIIGAMINALNIFFNYVFIFGRLGMPRLGVEGAALGTAMALMAGTLVFIAVLAGGKLGFSLPHPLPALDMADIKRIMRVSVPAGVEQLVIQIGFMVFTVIILRFGTEVYAAHQVGMRIQSLAFLPGMGFSIAAATLVGQSLGANRSDLAGDFGRGCMKLSMVTMIIMTVFVFTLARPIAWIFTDEHVVIDNATVWIRILTLGIPAFAVFFTLAGALRGAGDSRFPLYASVLGLYAIRLPMALVLGFFTPLGVYGVWLSLSLEYYFRAAFIEWRFRKGAWKDIDV